MAFTKHATDLFISAKIAAVTAVGASDISREFQSSASWLSSFGLCVIIQNHPPEQNRQFALQFIRRVEMAFAEYSRSVECLADLVGGGQGRWSPYYRALYYFEAAVAQLYLAYDSTRKKLGQNDFTSGDGSVLDRLNKVYNASKHDLASSEQVTWVTNDGISTSGSSVTFAELEDLLRQDGRIADRITNQRTNEQDA
jgi:hypothetical protein